jgi:hypothetical protein
MCFAARNIRDDEILVKFVKFSRSRIKVGFTVCIRVYQGVYCTVLLLAKYFLYVYFHYIVDCSKSADGYYRYPYDCSMFVQCVSGKSFINQCSPSLQFNLNNNQCDWPYNVDCTAQVMNTTTTTTTSATTTLHTSSETGTDVKSPANSGYPVLTRSVSLQFFPCFILLFLRS